MPYNWLIIQWAAGNFAKAKLTNPNSVGGHDDVHKECYVLHGFSHAGQQANVAVSCEKRIIRYSIF